MTQSTFLMFCVYDYEHIHLELCVRSFVMQVCCNLYSTKNTLGLTSHVKLCVIERFQSACQWLVQVDYIVLICFHSYWKWYTWDIIDDVELFCRKRVKSFFCADWRDIALMSNSLALIRESRASNDSINFVTMFNKPSVDNTTHSRL